jgi:hypothetical protein
VWVAQSRGRVASDRSFGRWIPSRLASVYSLTTRLRWPGGSSPRRFALSQPPPRRYLPPTAPQLFLARVQGTARGGEPQAGSDASPRPPIPLTVQPAIDCGHAAWWSRCEEPPSLPPARTPVPRTRRVQALPSHAYTSCGHNACKCDVARAGAESRSPCVRRPNSPAVAWPRRPSWPGPAARPP